tara:strand:- start:17017 stop:17979 length:963 start_codon:yes stop_codon:yes gene_type:complete
MKCHLIFPQQDKRTGFAIKNALKRANVNVFISDPNVFDWTSILNREVSNKSDFVLMSRTAPLNKFVMKYKEIYKTKTKFVCWNTDKRRDNNHYGAALLNLFKQCDLFYTVANGDVERFKDIGIEAKWLSQGVDVDTFCKDVEYDSQYECDVAFMGSYPSPLIGGKPVHKGRNELINYVQDKCERYGYSFRLYRPYDGTAVHGNEFIKACRVAKVVLSHNGFANIGPSPSVRLYEVLGSKGNVLEEWSERLQETFGSAFFTYIDPQDAWENIRLIIGFPSVKEKGCPHLKEATRIASKKCIASHTYDHRIKQILGDIRGNK